MTPFRLLDAVAVPLAESNIDTDQLVPGRFLMNPVRAQLLLHDRRFAANGARRPDFILNWPAYEGAEIIVAQRNFGIGSSREYAVLALRVAGFRCVIAVSFGDIFYSNCLQNGVLPIILDERVVQILLHHLQINPGSRLKVDLAAQEVTATGLGVYEFAISSARKQCLLEGLDDVELTDRYCESYRTFETEYYQEFPWLVRRP